MCCYVNDTVKIRLLIHKEILHMLLYTISDNFQSQEYLGVMYRALYSTAYYGLFRVSEVTAGEHPLLARDINIGDNKDKVWFLLRTSKTHWKDVKPQSIKISSMKSNKLEKKGNITLYTMEQLQRKEMCPFKLLREYLRIRPTYMHDSEPFFIFRDCSPVRPDNMRKVLKDALSHCGLNPNAYDTHSLRIGHCIDLHRHYNVSVSTIKSLGWWKSNSVYVYLK